MFQKQCFSYLMTTFICVFMMLMMGCFDTTYVPASIEFISPGNGKVFSPETEYVSIVGQVIPGDSDIMQVRVVKSDGSYEPLDLNEENQFTYDFPLDSGNKYSTCTVEVLDAKLKSNMERISFAVGESIEKGSFEASAEALLGLSMTDRFLQEATPMMEEVINDMLPDLIDSMLPLDIDLSEIAGLDVGHLIVDPDVASDSGEYGEISFGDISVEMYIEPDNTIGASVIITSPENTDEKAIFLQGHHYYEGLIFTYRTNVLFSADYAEIQDIKLQLGINEDNQIVATPILDDITLSLEGTNVEYGILGLPEWMLDAVIEVLIPILKNFDLGEIPILDVDELILQDIMGMDVGVSFPNDPIVQTSANGDAMRIDLGLAMNLTDWDNSALNPDVTAFYATPGDVMPTLMANPESGLEDIIMIISDDMVNQALFVLIQSGMLADLDLTNVITDQFPVLVRNNSGLKVTASVKTPPIADFSGDFEPITDESGNTVTFGKFAMSNLVIEIQNLQLTTFGRPHTMRLSIDLETVLAIGLNDDMTKIEAKADVDLDDITMKVLYTSDTGSAIMNMAIDIGLNLVKSIIQEIIPVALSLDIPDLGLDMALPEIAFTESAFENNYLITKLDVQF